MVCSASLLAVGNQSHIINCRLLRIRHKRHSPFAYYRHHFAVHFIPPPNNFQKEIFHLIVNQLFFRQLLSNDMTQPVGKRIESGKTKNFINIFTGNSNFSFSFCRTVHRCTFENKSSLGFSAGSRKSR